MSLSSENLVGYLRAEFGKSGKLRVWLFFVQLAAGLPAAISVVIPDHERVVLYVLAIVGVVLLVAWWVLNEFYVSARSAAQAARRGAMLLGGLNQPLSATEIQSLRGRFTVTSEQARKCEKSDYYATNEPPGPARLAEMLEESALYSEHLQRISANVMLGLVVLFALPFLPSEDFADVWTDEQYENFRDKIHTYREWIDDAYNETDRNESIAKWRRVFGDDFAGGVVLEEGRSVGKSAVALLKTTVSTAALFAGDLVEAVRQYGGRAIPSRIYNLPYMDRPTWRRAPQVIVVNINADLHQSENGPFVKHVDTLDPLPPGCWLHFQASAQTGMAFNPNDYAIEWRVTNTDEAAYLANCLRGKFYNSAKDNTRWERLQYRGVHLVEAFVILKRNNTLIGQSGAFRVVIE